MSAKLFLNRHNDGLAIQAISPPPRARSAAGKSYGSWRNSDRHLMQSLHSDE